MKRALVSIIMCIGMLPLFARAQDDLESKLEALSPGDPAAYFRLAEDVADQARDVESVQLARRLYVLAFMLADQSQSDTDAEFPIAASACVGLAALERTEDRKRWLLSLAGRLDERYAKRRWDTMSDDEQASEAALLLSEAIGLVLSGDGSLARERFDDPRVTKLLEETRDILNRPGSGASSTGIQREAEIWPCPECGNARGVPDRSEGGQVRRFCSTCRGNPGPVITRETLVAYLSYQSLLLHGTQRSWSAELAVNQGRPLLDPQPSEVPVNMGVNPTKVHYRDGQWLDDEELMELQDGVE